ncbi:MAG: gamma-glutamyltransferase [Rhodospirillales bacterium]|nr:gamma-glutamyltransferase [Rhodospirillales bacterium]
MAAGHPETAKAAAIVLEEGGNAFDAALAAIFAACIAEPVLTSLGGGGFLLAKPLSGEGVIYDFFAHTPKVRRPDGESALFPIIADFGATQQEFHIGMGSIATPGMVAGLFAVHADLGRMPLAKIVEPALALTRDGVLVNRLQAYIFEVVGPIYRSNDTCCRVYASTEHPDRLVCAGDRFRLPGYADTLEALVREGEAVFYRGDMACVLLQDCAENGGHLTLQDMEGYRVAKRRPLSIDFCGARILTNPPPSLGGILIAFGLELLQRAGIGKAAFGSIEHLSLLSSVMDATNRARVESAIHDMKAEDVEATLLSADLLGRYEREVLGAPSMTRGTTHISIIDAEGNAASVTTSNGEGCGYLIPGTGIMMNNMLGEEDINPHGFNRWPTDRRMASMMAPSMVLRPNGGEMVLGSGGSNRIRTAILQVLVNVLAFGMPLDKAVSHPRIHYEGGDLCMEAGFDGGVLRDLCATFPRHRLWQEMNLFFGGVHAVSFDPSSEGFSGVGDARRGGVAVVPGAQ